MGESRLQSLSLVASGQAHPLAELGKIVLGNGATLKQPISDILLATAFRKGASARLHVRSEFSDAPKFAREAKPRGFREA